MLKAGSKLRAGAKKFVRTYNGKPRWFDAVTESLPSGSVVRRGVNGGYYVVHDGKCAGTFDFSGEPQYTVRRPEFEQVFRAAEARWRDKTVLIGDGKIRQTVRGILTGAKAFREGYAWFKMIAEEAPLHGYSFERSNYGGYALFQGEVDVAIIGFDRGPAFTAYRPIAKDFLESVKSEWKARRERD